MRKMVIFGGTGGIGSELRGRFPDTWDVMHLGSKDVNITSLREVENFFISNSDTEVVLNLSGCNYNSFLHKYENSEQVERQININIVGNINILRGCIPFMRENEYGRIILASSILSKRTVVGTSIYSSCKSFIESLVRVVAAENALKGITVNALRMGYMDAGLTYKIPPTYREKILNEIPCQEWGKIRDLATLIQCIIDTPYINGTSIDIAGGL